MSDPYAKYPGLKKKSKITTPKNIPDLGSLELYGSPAPRSPNGVYGGSYGSTEHMKRINAAKRRTQQKASGGSDPTQELQDMLGMGLAGGGVDIGSLSAQLKASIAGQYDPQIAFLKKEMERAKGRTKSAQKDIGAIYDDLVGYYEGKSKPTKAMYNNAKSEAKANANSLKSAINADYTARLKEQVDMYKQLGIESAAPSATEGQISDQASATANADVIGGAEQSALNQEEMGDLSYWSEGAGAAKTEGAETKSDLELQLQDYLNQQGGQIAGLQGQKSAAYNQALIKLQQDAAQQQMQSQNELWNRMLDIAKLKQGYARMSLSGSGSNALHEGLLGVRDYLGDTGNYGAFQRALAEASTWTNSAQAKLYYGGHSPSSPEEMAQVIRDNAANHGMSPADQLKLWQAALIYYGRLK